MIDLQSLPAGKWADDNAALFEQAAIGDHAAQLAMSDHVLAMTRLRHVPLWEGLLVAEMYARMAATSGDVKHLRQVAVVLGARHDVGEFGPIGDAGPDVKLSLEVEIITILDQIADEGSSDDGAMLETAARRFSPEALAHARQIRAAVLEEAD